jgi:hypothetical protein
MSQKTEKFIATAVRTSEIVDFEVLEAVLSSGI